MFSCSAMSRAPDSLPGGWLARQVKARIAYRHGLEIHICARSNGLLHPQFRLCSSSILEAIVGLSQLV
jgi:hypothetical protein